MMKTHCKGTNPHFTCATARVMSGCTEDALFESSFMTTNQDHVVIIGAGIIGAACAHAALDQGFSVTILDPSPPGGPQAASYGNGAFISPASVIPMSMPGLWKTVPGLLLNPLGPLTIRWQNLPSLLPWLWRFLRAGATEARVRRTAAALNSLLRDAPQQHKALAAKIGREELIAQQGLVYAYPDREAFKRDRLAWQIRRDNGLTWNEIEGKSLRKMAPNLAHHYQFAALVGGGAHCLDPGAYVAALIDAAIGRGAQLERREALGFAIEDGRLIGVETARGRLLCDRAVISAGIRSARLAALAGDRVPLVSERGYHVQLPDAHGGPALPILPSDGRMANTPLRCGLRASGQVELASTGTLPDWRRAEILLENLRFAYPQLTFDESKVQRWMGHRPSTPDGLPVIGQARLTTDIIYAFGHGHVGLASAPATAGLVASLLGPGASSEALAPFAASRFR